MKSSKTVLIIATLDTKAEETHYIKELIEGKGIQTLVVDIGTIEESPPFADITNQEVVGMAQRKLSELISFNDESKAMAIMAEGAEKIIADLLAKDAFDGVLAIGGTMGTSLVVRIFRMLPLRMTKVLVSTVALSSFVTPQSIQNNVILVQVSTDIWGLNRVVKRDLTRAALAVAGAMESEDLIDAGDKPFVAMTTLGGSWLKYAYIAKKRLEDAGYEVAVFHAVSMQGAIMERLIMEGKVSGVMDLCPQEILSEHCGGFCFSPGRLEASSKMGVPQVVSPGGFGAFPWGSLEDLPERFKGRLVKAHNEIATAIKASVKEMSEVGQVMAKKLNRSKGTVVIVIPEKGFHEYDRPGQLFHDPEGRVAFLKGLEEKIKPDIELIKMGCHINDPEYAEMVSEIAIRIFREEINE